MQEVRRRMIRRKIVRYETHRSRTGGIRSGLHGERAKFAGPGDGHATGVVTAARNAGREFFVRVEISERAVFDRVEEIVQIQIVRGQFVNYGQVCFPEQIDARVGRDHGVAVVQKFFDDLDFVVSAEGFILRTGKLHRKKRTLVHDDDGPAAGRRGAFRNLPAYVSINSGARLQLRFVIRTRSFFHQPSRCFATRGLRRARGDQSEGQRDERVPEADSAEYSHVFLSRSNLFFPPTRAGRKDLQHPCPPGIFAELMRIGA